MIRALLALFALMLATPAAAQVPSPDPAVETARLEDLTSIRQIKHLQAHWGHLALRGQWPAMVELLTDDAVVSFQHGELLGRAEVLANLRETQGGGVDGLQPGLLNLHLWISPVITLAADGQNATGRWQELALTGTAQQSAEWAGGTWVVRYAKQGADWRIAAMRYYPQFAGPYAQGWRHDATTLERAPYHFTPEQAGAILPQRRAATILPPEQIAAEASLLYEHGRAQNLVNAFGYYLDRGLYDDVTDLFYADARVVVQGQGTWLGQDGVRRFLAQFGAAGLDRGELNDHLQLMPKVILSRDGVVASVSVIELGMTGQHGGEGQWSATLNHFVLMRDAEGRWLISSLYRIPIMRSTYAAGWAEPLPPLVPIPAGGGPDRDQPSRSMSYPEASVTQPISDLGIFAPAVVAGAAPSRTPDALTRAEAFDAAENLGNAYGAYINRFSWDEMAALFAPNGWRELPFIGVVAGRERILAAARLRYGDSQPSPAFQAVHMLTQPYVTVSRDEADGTWRAQMRERLVQMNSSASGPGSWLAGVYEWQLERRPDGHWAFAGMDLDYTWIAGYAGGWTAADPALGEALRPTPELLARYRVDALQRGAIGVPFPAIEPLPFHYANPVSGRPPERRVEWTEIAPR
ncbi:MAG: nuclear transport factor 2 family protein [Alteraurantiacibacter sp.]